MFDIVTVPAYGLKDKHLWLTITFVCPNVGELVMLWWIDGLGFQIKPGHLDTVTMVTNSQWLRIM